MQKKDPVFCPVFVRFLLRLRIFTNEIKSKIPQTMSMSLWNHPSVELPTLMQQVKSFVQILLLAIKEIEWTDESYQQAMQWADYLTNVCTIRKSCMHGHTYTHACKTHTRTRTHAVPHTRTRVHTL